MTDTKISDEQAANEVQQARSRAERYRSDPKATEELLNAAADKARRKGSLRDVFDDLMLLIAMVRAYFSGAYRDVPWDTIAVSLGALLYFLSPVDLIPDVLPFLGYVDDAAIIAFVLRSIRLDVDAFRIWKETRDTTTQPDATKP